MDSGRERERERETGEVKSLAPHLTKTLGPDKKVLCIKLSSEINDSLNKDVFFSLYT